MSNAVEQKNKMVIYQVFPRWFGNLQEPQVSNGTIQENGVGKFSAFTPLALSKIKEMGITHVWYTGVIEHATKTDYTAYGIQRDHRAVVKGKAGSPYAIKDYYDIDPDLADEVPHRMAEFEALVKRTHEAGMQVIIDFVPNHVARQYHSDAKESFVEDLGEKDNTSVAFDRDNNFYYIPGQCLELHFGAQQEDFEYSEFPAKVTGNDHFDAHPGRNDWYETIKLNYGVDYLNGRTGHFNPIPNTWHKMLNILEFWASKGIDGFRCDMAEMVPVEFWNWVIPKVKANYPVVFIAEVYNPAQYRNYIFNGHFDYLYDKVGLYDTLRAVICGHAAAKQITSCWQSLEGIQANMLNFLENHDEQRLASDFFAGKAQAGIPGLIVSALLNTNPMMIYAGQELGERGMDQEGFSGRDGRTTIFDYWSLGTLRKLQGKDNTWRRHTLNVYERELREYYAKVFNIARTEDCVARGGFYDLQYANHDNPGYDVHRQYAFFRNLGRDVLLIIANFDGEDKEVSLNVPKEAWNFVGVTSRRRHIENLLTGQWDFFDHDITKPMTYTVPAYGAVVLKIQGT